MLKIQRGRRRMPSKEEVKNKSHCVEKINKSEEQNPVYNKKVKNKTGYVKKIRERKPQKKTQQEGSEE